jgi:hypothetical protein
MSDVKNALDHLEERVKEHRQAYGLDIFPNSEKLTAESSRESVAARMGRHMCDCFLRYIFEARASFQPHAHEEGGRE